jgi:drug/metabolite transporter (DMT)-like permease
VGVLVGLGPVPLSGPVLGASVAALLGAMSYGCAAVYTRARAPAIPPLAQATYCLLFAALVLLPAVPFTLPSEPPTQAAVVSMLLLALLSTSFAYVLYFYLINRLGPTRATMVTYLAPAFGMLWGALLLAEPLGVGSFVGFGLILASVALVNDVRLGRRRAVGARGAGVARRV